MSRVAKKKPRKPRRLNLRWVALSTLKTGDVFLVRGSHLIGVKSENSAGSYFSSLAILPDGSGMVTVPAGEIVVRIRKGPRP